MATRSVWAVVGGQWGDEGKGKVVDRLTDGFDLVIRPQGGANAGHTIKLGDEKYVLHLLPSGVMREGVRSLLGSGMVVDLGSLLKEIDDLAERGIDVSGRLFLASSANLLLPYHKRLDELREKTLSRKSIGTTGRGIGPCYEDKMARTGLRAGDLLRPRDALRRLVIDRVLAANKLLAGRYDAPAMASEAVAEELLGQAERGRSLVVNGYEFLRPVREGKWRTLLEGAQGSLLDVDHGTYPYVTSSNCTIGGALTGSGLPARCLERVIGVYKAYATRVGNGPFPTELFADEAEDLRALGAEFGATTGRPRRCGWFDAAAARYAAEINGIDEVALTKLDVLTGSEIVRIGVGYELAGKALHEYPVDIDRLMRCKPVYQEMPGWKETITEARRFDHLPINAQRYVAELEARIGAPVRYISTGARREAWIDRQAAERKATTA
jgi:adenylosuccinate synthase